MELTVCGMWNLKGWVINYEKIRRELSPPPKPNL